MPPATAPMQYGTSTEESAKAPPNARRVSSETTALRNAKLAPRRTMPKAAMLSGTKRVRVIDAYASGKAVQVTTKTKISQTWLASHTGPIERSITERARAPRWAPPAVRSQKPAPKVGASEDGVRHQREQQHEGDQVGHRAASSTLGTGSGGAPGPYGVSFSRNPPARRKRRLIARRTRIVVTPRATYSMTTQTRVSQTPWLAVAASSTFIRL